MLMLRRFAATLRRWLSRDRAERELRDEIESCAALLADEQRAAGVSSDEARRRAQIELGGVAQVEESVRESRTGAFVEQTWQDVRYAVRGLRRTRGFTVTAIVTLGLGIGVTTAVFAVLNATLLRPLPYDRPEEIVEIGHTLQVAGTPSTAFGVTWREVRFWRAQTQLCSGVEARDLSLPPMQWREGGTTLRIGRFTAGMPDLLGVRPILGRSFTVDENAGGAPVIILSDALWQRGFDRESAAVGRTMTIDRTVFTVIGVMPAAFRYGPPGDGVMDAWTVLPERGTSATPDVDMTMAVCRLRSGLSVDRANALASAIAPEIQAEIHMPPPFDLPWVPRLSTLDSWRMLTSRETTLSPMLMLLVTAAAVLLIACANVANLLSARGIARSAELKMRSALGASRARLVRLLAIEGAVVASLSATAGVVCAECALAGAQALMPEGLTQQLFAAGPPELDWRVLMFAAGLTVLIAVMSSLWPAISNSSVTIAGFADARVVGHATLRRRRAAAIQAAQVSVALVLVVGAGLSARSLWAAMATDVGFDVSHLAVFSMELPAERYASPESARLAASALLAAARELPGADRAAVGPTPTSTSTSYYFEVEGTDAIRKVRLSIRNRVGDGYFSAAGIRLIAGREFGSEDVQGGPRVVILDEAAVRRFFGDQPALGRRVRFGPRSDFLTVVGIAATAVSAEFTREDQTLGAYTAASQLAPSRYVSIIIRTRNGMATVLSDAQTAFRAVEPNLRMSVAEPAARAFDRAETFQQPRFLAGVVAMLAVLAMVTASVGLFSLLGYAVAQREREIGLRLALGSSMNAVRRLVLTDALHPVMLGLVTGTAMAWLLMRYVAHSLYGVTTSDPVVFTGSAAMLLISGLIATIGPIRRATGVDPISSLRAE